MLGFCPLLAFWVAMSLIILFNLGFTVLNQGISAKISINNPSGSSQFLKILSVLFVLKHEESYIQRYLHITLLYFKYDFG